jgi:hypothetical protein
MLGKLDELNHTRLHNHHTNKENKKQDKIYNKIRITKIPIEKKNDDDVLFPRIDIKIPKKKKYKQENKEDSIIFKRPNRKETTVFNRSDRKLSLILRNENDIKPLTTINNIDHSTMLTTEINHNNERDEYYQMIVDNEVQLYKNYLIAPGQSSTIQTETNRINNYESGKHIGLHSLLDKKEIEYYNDQKKSTIKVKFTSSFIRGDLSDKIKTPKNVRKTKTSFQNHVLNIEDRKIEKSASLRLGLELRRNAIDSKLKPLKFYVTENLKRLNDLNDEYKKNFMLFNNYFENINYDNELEKNIIFDEVINK